MFPSVTYLLRVRNEISTCQYSLIWAATFRAHIPSIFFVSSSIRFVADLNAALSWQDKFFCWISSFVCQKLSFGLAAQSEVGVLRKEGRGMLEKTHRSWATRTWHYSEEVLNMLKWTCLPVVWEASVCAVSSAALGHSTLKVRILLHTNTQGPLRSCILCITTQQFWARALRWGTSLTSWEWCESNLTHLISSIFVDNAAVIWHASMWPCTFWQTFINSVTAMTFLVPL